MNPDAPTDFLIIGAGFSGLVVAERLASAGWKCVVADRRDHLGGNAHDRTDAAGVLIHQYGPHYFRTNRDNRYLTETFQALPAKGYTAMFENLLAATPGIELHLGIDFHEAKARWNHKHLIFTGAIDEYFGRCFGPLPYRSLRFEPESFTADELRNRESISGKPGYCQPAMQVNYPDQEIPFTRIVEIKHATGQNIGASTVVREFPKDWTPDDEPYSPIPAPDTRALYQRYAELATSETNTCFIDRLATCRYYNMDQVTAMALTEADKLIARYGNSQPLPQ